MMTPVYTISSVFSTIFSWLMANAAMALQMIGSWFTFRKMGLPGWKGLIPYYSLYVLFDKLWETKKFWRMIVYLCIYIGVFLFGYLFLIFGVGIGAASDAAAGAAILIIIGILMLIGSIVLLVLTLKIQFRLFKRLAAAFGLQNGWAWGLLFVPYVMFPIIGFNKKILYYGPVNQV